MWNIISRGRRKRVYFLSILLVFLLYAFIQVSVELYNTILYKKDNLGLRLKEDTALYEKGLKVIVGHYLGGASERNLTDEEIHGNNYAPLKGAGDRGRPYYLSSRELVKAKELFRLHSYNILVGDRVAINRTLPDVRSDSCREVEYDITSLPTASVVIVFHNEAWSTLMRTVMSVINRTPELLLKQVILVDDASDRRYLGVDLEDAISKLNKVKLLRLKKRTGLIGARLHGAEAALGDVLLFLDAHCEVTIGWIEPLLDRANSEDVFICPHIDLISPDTLAYTQSVEAHLGAFNWNLHFRWIMPSPDIMQLKANNPAKPYPSPAMAGGLFAVRKDLFWDLGGYDDGMKIWGGENLEMSWRAWQCGARIEITPCSRVGHIFRERPPYKYPGGVENVLNSNIARAVTVWMDDWADFFFKFNPRVEEAKHKQDVSKRVALRKTLNCYSFKWYLEHVWPTHFFPSDDRWFGRIRNGRGACLAGNSDSPWIGRPAVGVTCGSDLEVHKLLVFTIGGRVMADEGLCLDRGIEKVLWKTCTDSPSQVWRQRGPRLKTDDGLCLTLIIGSEDSTTGVNDPLKVRKCDSYNGQIWRFERVPWR